MAKLLFFAFCLFSMSAAGSAVSALEIKNLPEGWVFQKITPGSFEAGLTGAQGAISLKRGEEVLATILVFEKPLPKRESEGKSLSYWRRLVVPDANLSKRSIQYEGLLEPKSGGRYIVEYSTDTGTETQLQSAVMAQKSGDSAVELRFENHRKVYKTYSQEILKLFKEAAIE